MSLRIFAGALLALSLGGVQAQTFSFGLWGDMPYQKSGDGPKIPALLNSLNQSDIAFSLYNGDFKDGSSPCSDDAFTTALNMFAQLEKPLVYVPGDNEWSDCHRLNNGGYDALAHQGAPGQPYAENTRFSHRGIVFVTLNMPGNNNLVLDEKSCQRKSARSPAQCEARNAEYLARDAANVRWLQEAFKTARAQHARGLVMVMQADPGFDLPETRDKDESLVPKFSGYRNFIQHVVAETEQFPGQVLLVHGDTHFFKVDKPLYSPGKLLPNLTRLQTFGSPLIHWVRVTVEPEKPNVFAVQPVIVAQ